MHASSVLDHDRCACVC
ncbi:hypothetical protein EFP20_12270 [Burkholderia glumae]|nr:hypothetical protein EFP17_30370 [Burkholderia glumae]UVS99805.1 hypothetical protein EFP19_27875 [Burkholderia glumae]UVT05386.1 hypothetical protein EFP20_12270 [Burkholderia glumae]